MRVQMLGGAWKGRAVVIPKELGLRPTSQKVRAALFNLLGPRVAGARVLDLFAGTGALGLEAASRGAAAVTFVERSAACTDALRRTLTTFGPLPGLAAEVVTFDVFATIRRLAGQGKTFDLVLADPPYGGPWGRKSLQGVSAHAIIAAAGTMVLEGPTGEAPPPGLQPTRQVRYGDTTLSFYDQRGLSRHL
ncbi:MAG: 16S rRNA (guanine(966)-N(2))-methyltransferase RsmD [Omnitrophica WOR_2 bacterium RIFCSPHIGHO2_02_FULL_68_15]|nr:MAG: 16S rRNA (guanine(966)-N(2))-methyltransferase RsmD [Omnitrophica WOR_2 bacterium RIFCSPHIGHO2_02_FULL_68_15]